MQNEKPTTTIAAASIFTVHSILRKYMSYGKQKKKLLNKSELNALTLNFGSESESQH